MSDTGSDRLGDQLEAVAGELAEIRRLDLSSRLLDVEDRLDQRVSMLRQLGDEWSSLVTPMSRAGGLKGLNSAVDALTRRVRLLTIAVIALSVVTAVLAIAVLLG